ncbi:hypothetical protein B0T26DRAFT_752130 [Lasiosphaeria miniovina]|uniref:RanBD1 domain-containing protein n=1 Tax=Lasiosphaeria miniovina TaxID=1954250 RepID=A0AA40E0I2_9PEZI|nr:uncharacterized protein B0T26DRAFT_752130 [Lasiosphaeria miniovina]KAK0718173.1 hypothetical protein B0T26DRAFT_752130 [Lasiosphaeria miniovina]
MADDPHNTSDISDTIDAAPIKEDAETTAARRELKRTGLSEKDVADASQRDKSSSQDEKSSSDDDDSTPNDNAPPRTATPDADVGDAVSDELKAQVASPKKKRAHDELEEHKDDAADGSSKDASAPSEPVPSAGAAQNRTDRSEPEKKRARDGQAEDQDAKEESGKEKTSESDDSKKAEGAKPQTSSKSAFASSGFAKLASQSASPFGALGSGKPSMFGSSSMGSSSPFSVLGGQKPASGAAPPTSPPKLTFGSAAATASPFGGINGKLGGSGGGSAFGSAFGSVLGGRPGGSGASVLKGSRLGGSFGKPGNTLQSGKPAKPFGAPESDNEEEETAGDEDDASSSKGAGAGSDSDEKKDATAETDKDESRAAGSSSLDDKKKQPRLQKIVVDNGEGSEVTLLTVRAKMFQMEKGVGWKERGAGMLKINVPKASVNVDDNGNVIPDSFDASVLEDEDEGGDSEGRKHVRLIMRQDHTLRVILNTVIVPAMTFHLTQKLKSANILFTAFEGSEAKQVQMKMSEANATLFIQQVEMIKKQLADI